MNNIKANIQTPISAVVQPSIESASSSRAAIATNTNPDLVKKVTITEFKDSNIASNSQPSREAVAKAAEQIQNFVNKMGRNLSFSVDEATGYNVVRVVNPDTNEIIRQLPSEELLKIARSMESWNSVLVNQKA